MHKHAIVCANTHTHTQSLYSQTYSCIYILVSGDRFLEGQTRSCQLKHFVHLSRPPFISQLGSQKFADGKVSIKHPPGQTIWAQRHCQRPRSTCVITQHGPCLESTHGSEAKRETAAALPISYEIMAAVHWVVLLCLTTLPEPIMAPMNRKRAGVQGFLFLHEDYHQNMHLTTVWK